MTIMGIVRSMLMKNSLSHELWGDMISTYVCILNYAASRCLKGMSSYEIWIGMKPKKENLGVFGSLIHDYPIHDKHLCL